MAKEEKSCNCENCSCGGFSIISGLKFGFGMFVGFLAGTSIVTLVAVGIYYLVN